MQHQKQKVESKPLNLITKSFKNQKGMTLIEIMIVMAILGGLLAFLGTTVMDRFRKAKMNEAKLRIGELSKALEMYYADCGFYPTDSGGLNSLMEQDGECSNWGPDPYAKKAMLKDPWNTEFIYETAGSRYVLRSLGADRKEGGSGSDADLSSEEQ